MVLLVWSFASGVKKPIHIGYINYDLARDVDSRKFISGCLITFAWEGVALQSRLQKYITLLTSEAKLNTTIEAIKESFWMKKFINELGFIQKRYMLFCDCRSSIHLGKNHTFHGRSKQYWCEVLLDMWSFGF